jgi:hypothetical protein
MKKLLLLLVISCKFIATHAQTNRWMFLNKSKDGTIFLIDTIKDDITQSMEYDAHEDVVIFWTTVYSKVRTKKSQYIKTVKEKIAVDTTNKQYEIISRIEYKGDKVTSDQNGNLQNWVDAIPESLGEDLVYFAKSLHDDVLKWKLRLNAANNFNPYDKRKK